MTRQRTYGYDSVKMYQNMSVPQLTELMRTLQDDPANRLPLGSLYLYDTKTRRKLDAIGWAITYHLQDKRRAAKTPG